MYPTTQIYILTFAYGMSTFASGILMPIYAFYVQKIGGGILEASWAIGLYSVLCGVGTIVIHRTTWSHKYPRFFLCGGWFLWLVSMALYCVMHSVIVLYLSQVLNALGDALCEPVFDVEFSKEIEANPSEGWALFNGVTTIFSGVASLLGGAIATYFGFDVLFYCVVAMGTVSFLLIVRYVRNNGARRKTS